MGKNDGTLPNESRLGAIGDIQYVIEQLYVDDDLMIVALTDSQTVQSFEEKPEQPKSPFAVPAFYLYKKETLALFKDCLDEGNDPDAPGHFVPYLLEKKPVHAYLFKGKRYDIGTVESYERVKAIFIGK